MRLRIDGCIELSGTPSEGGSGFGEAEAMTARLCRKSLVIVERIL
jgi:hypothetical protein